MRHIPISILAIVAIVGIATLLYSVLLPPDIGPLAIQYVPARQAPAAANTFVIPNLDVGEFIGNDYPTIPDDLLPALGPQFIAGKETRADVFQTIVLRDTSPGGFNGGFIEFGRDERDQVSDFLTFDDVVFGVDLEFSPGLDSEIEGGEAVDLEGEDIRILGDTYSIAEVEVQGTSISIRLFGGFGTVDLTDNNFGDDVFYQGVKINQQNIDATVKIRAVVSGNMISIYSIVYRLNANAILGSKVQVAPLHCTRQYLQYPQGMFSPNFDICYAGISGAAAAPPRQGISGNIVQVDPRGDDKYNLVFTNTRGSLYEMPLADIDGGLHYGRGDRDLIFVEAPAPGAPNIDVGDYFVVMSKDDVNGVTNVLRYDHLDGNVVYFEDLGAGSRSATFDPGTGEGQLLVGEGTYRFVVGAGNALAMDQTNNGAISGNEAKVILAGGSKIDLGPGFTLKVITPSRLFDEPMGDETTEFDILGGSQIDLDVPSPQTTVPGYTFELQSEGGGVKSGLTKYGILFTWDKESQSDDLQLVVPGSYARPAKGGAQGGVYITLERPKLMKPTQAPPAQCGNKIKEAGEFCDPPGSLCVGPGPFERGTCSTDCKTCVIKPRAQCGNNLLENGEECENSADCPAGFGCQGCKCVPVAPVCGNMHLEPGEQCEVNADCGVGFMCSNCACTPPVVEVPAPVKQPNIFARFFAWLARLFGA